MIRQDPLSKAMLALALAGTVYLATFSTTTVVIFPAILLLCGLSMEYLFERRKKPEETGECFTSGGKKVDWRSIGYYGIISFFGILLVGYALSYSPLAAFGDFDSVVYAVIIAVAEEQFFRGFITDALLSTRIPAGGSLKAFRPILNNDYIKLFLSAAIFMFYHNARYSTDPNAMIYVLSGGFLLSWAAYKSQRLSPSMIAHGVNNLLSQIGFSIIKGLGVLA